VFDFNNAKKRAECQHSGRYSTTLNKHRQTHAEANVKPNVYFID